MAGGQVGLSGRCVGDQGRKALQGWRCRGAGRCQSDRLADATGWLWLCSTRTSAAQHSAAQPSRRKGHLATESSRRGSRLAALQPSGTKAQHSNQASTHLQFVHHTALGAQLIMACCAAAVLLPILLPILLLLLLLAALALACLRLAAILRGGAIGSVRAIRCAAILACRVPVGRDNDARRRRLQLGLQQLQQLWLGLPQIVAASQRVAQRQRGGTSWQCRISVVPAGHLDQQAAISTQLRKQLFNSLQAKWAGWGGKGGRKQSAAMQTATAP